MKDDKSHASNYRSVFLLTGFSNTSIW